MLNLNFELPLATVKRLSTLRKCSVELQNVQESDTTDDDRSTGARYKISFHCNPVLIILT